MQDGIYQYIDNKCSFFEEHSLTTWRNYRGNTVLLAVECNNKSVIN